MQNIEQHLIQKLLDQIKKNFYLKRDQRRYYEDKRMLVYTITWPATWLSERCLETSQQKYEQIITQILNDIVKHGNHSRYQQYFPRYLLKCTQLWFIHNGDHLYDELKHIRNHAYAFDSLIEAIKGIPKKPTQNHHFDIETMTKTHQLLKTQSCRKRQNTDTKQLNLI